MERLTYDFCIGGNHCWQVKGADNLECREVCERQGDDGCKTCPIAKAFDRLAAYEDTGLEPEECRDAALAIKALRADLVRVTAERDAAVGCLKNKCPFCRKYLTCQGRTINNDCWEFFGLKED